MKVLTDREYEILTANADAFRSKRQNEALAQLVKLHFGPRATPPAPHEWAAAWDNAKEAL